LMKISASARERAVSSFLFPTRLSTGLLRNRSGGYRAPCAAPNASSVPRRGTGRRVA
jgi:hypothetical protein